MKLKPLDDRIVIKQVEAEEKTSGGIILPDSAKEKPQIGKVVATGPGAVLDDGKSLAYASDAGTPLIADPGYRLVEDARASGHAVHAVPGKPIASVAYASASA